MFRMVTTLSVAVVLSCGLSVFGAPVYFEDDFEGYSEFQVPDNPSPAGASWTITENAPSDQKVYTDDRDGNKVLRIYDGSTSEACVADAYLDQPRSGAIVISYDMQINTQNWSNVLSIQMHDKDGGMPIFIQSVKGYNDTQATFRNRADTNENVFQYDMGEWYHIEITADLPASTYDLKVTGPGVNYNGTVDTYSNTRDDIEYISFKTLSTTKSYHWIDNLQVVPEPMSMLLLMFGAVISLVRRR